MSTETEARNRLLKSISILMVMLTFVSIEPLLVALQEVDSYRQAGVHLSLKAIQTTMLPAEANFSHIDEATTCRRKCASRPNRIVIMSNSAGLESISGALFRWSNLAAALCATVHTRSPSAFLSPGHNHDLLGIANTTGGRVHPSLRWIDFNNVTYIDDNSPALIHHVYPKDHKMKGTWRNKLIVTKSREQFAKHFKRAEAVSFGKKYAASFTWIIDGLIYYNFPKSWNALAAERQNRKRKRGQLYFEQLPAFTGAGTCHYTRMTYPDHFDRLLNVTMKRIREVTDSNNATAMIGLLHLRRGDSKKACDTTLPVVRSFLECSLNASSTLDRPVVLALASDEKDMEYRQSVTGLIYGLGKNFYGLDLDAMVWNMLADEAEAGRVPYAYINNFHVYKITRLLYGNMKQYGVHFHLERRRHLNCKPCQADEFEKGLEFFESSE